MPDKIRLTKELLKRCLNEGLGTYAWMLKSDPEAARAIAENPATREWFYGGWVADLDRGEAVEPANIAYRLSPSTEPDPDYTDVRVVQDGGVYGYTEPREISSFRLVRPVGYAISTVGFEGYVYPEQNGEIPVLRLLDLSFGVPTHVRFSV